MKKVIFGGFCMLVGVYLLVSVAGYALGAVFRTTANDVFAQLVGLALMIFGGVLGFIGLREDDKKD